MSLGFGAPALLAGTAAALVPLLLHLLRRRPPNPTLFPAFLLLLGPTERHARRRRLRELLLLATRMALLALVAITLAGPYLSHAVPVPPVAHRHQAAVIVVDDTLSMRFRKGGRTLFEEARRRASALLDVLPPSAPAALLTVSDRGAQVPELGVDRAPLRRALAKLGPTHLAAPGAEALSRALRVLSGAPAKAPRAIYLLTDLTRSGLTVPPGLVPPDTALQVIDVAEGPLPNRAVMAFEPVGGPAADAGSPGASPGGAGSARRYRVRLLNSTDRDEGMRVRLLAGGRELAKTSLAVPAREEIAVELSVPAAAIPAEEPFLEASLASDDGLAEDDRRFLPTGREAGMRVLLVDGDPRETRHEDELFYLEAALGALGSRAPLGVRVMAAGDLEGATLEEVDLVVLANVAAPSRAVVAALGAFVRRGGALLVALGDQVDPEAYNQTLGSSLLPARLRAIRSGGAAGPEGQPAQVDPDHAAPALAWALDASESRRSLRAAKVQRYALLEGLRGDVLLRLDTGAPLLVAESVGAGRVVLLTTTLDRDWGDLALRPAFLPLVQGLLAYLTGQGAAGAAQVLVGRPVTLRAQVGERLLVQTPSGAFWALDPVGPGGVVTFSHTDVPGPYRVFAAPPPRAQVAPPPSRRGLGGGSLAFADSAFLRLLPPAASPSLAAAGIAPRQSERPGLAFAVVTDPAESDLRRLARTPGQAGRLGGAPAGSVSRSEARVRKDLVPWFALLVLFAFLVEGLLAARFSRWRASRSKDA